MLLFVCVEVQVQVKRIKNRITKTEYNRRVIKQVIFSFILSFSSDRLLSGDQLAVSGHKAVSWNRSNDEEEVDEQESDCLIARLDKSYIYTSDGITRSFRYVIGCCPSTSQSHLTLV